MNPFELDEAIPGPRVIEDEDGIGRCSPGNTSCVVILSYVCINVSYALELMDDAEIYSNVYVQFASASTRYLHLEDPLSASINCTSELHNMVSSSTALTVAQVCPRDRNGADSSTLSEPFLPVLLPLQGDYGMLKKA
jgi:hypothetical protein